MTDWRAWHQQYDDNASALSRRLAVVQARLATLVDGTHTVKNILSLCAGDGRDLLPVLARSSGPATPAAVLVELDPALAAAAADRAATAHLDNVTVVVGDAGRSATWKQALPVDLLLLCGIFGNISEEDIQRCVHAAAAMLTPTGAVIWTRGAFGHRDIRPLVRRWFGETGFDELSYDEEPGRYGIGVNRKNAATSAGELPETLFTFLR